MHKYAESVVPGPDLSSGNYWGWAYQRGIEHGPVSKEHAVAAGKAEDFMAKQLFAAYFAKRAYAFSGSDLIEVSFASLSIPGGKARAVIRVNPKTGECSWLGIKDAASRTRIVVAVVSNYSNTYVFKQFRNSHSTTPYGPEIRAHA